MKLEHGSLNWIGMVRCSECVTSVGPNTYMFFGWTQKFSGVWGRLRLSVACAHNRYALPVEGPDKVVDTMEP